MDTFNVKKKIEEKTADLDKLLAQLENEQKKLILFRSKKKIDEIQRQISQLDTEIAKLEETYNSQLEFRKNADIAMNGAASFVKKYGVKAGIGCAAACLGYLGYLSNKPLTVNGEQTTYRSMIATYENTDISAEDYTPETYERFMHDLEDAEAQKSDIFMSDEEKLAYIDAVSASYDALEPMPDKTALQAALSKADRYDVSAYTPNSADSFHSEVSKMKVIYDDVNATEKEVTDAENAIAEAYALLTLKADKTELNELYEQYSDYVLDGYTPSSADSFRKRLQDSQKLIRDENASQNSVNSQVKAMESIESLLVLKADKTALESLIDECSKLNGDDYNSGYDKLLSEIKLSESILEDDNVSQDKVDSAVASLKKAEGNLVEFVINVYRVNMYAVMNSNNSVGNDWSYDRYYNGSYVHDGFEVSGEPGSTVTVGMDITENDKSPDSGYDTVSISLENGYQTSFDITVREDRGRYSGNTATFTVYVSVTYLRRA